jgi:hypothetical protein
MPANNENLAQIIVATDVATVEDVISVLRSLDDQLSNDDGLKWFNLLYLKVTEGVRHQSAAFRCGKYEMARTTGCDFCEAIFCRDQRLAAQS